MDEGRATPTDLFVGDVRLVDDVDPSDGRAALATGLESAERFSEGLVEGPAAVPDDETAFAFEAVITGKRNEDSFSLTHILSPPVCVSVCLFLAQEHVSSSDGS